MIKFFMLAKRGRGRPSGTLRQVRWKSLFVLMQAAGYDDARLAGVMGVKARAVGDWRRGIRVPSKADIKKIAEVLTPDDALAAANELNRDAPRKNTRKKFTNCVNNSQKKV